jgi:hypothetical protein
MVKKVNEESWMKIQPTLHWNNFTLPELKQILEHCTALERLGIAQDEEMMCSIERDITLREKEPLSGLSALKNTTMRKPMAQSRNTRQQSRELLLEQTV